MSAELVLLVMVYLIGGTVGIALLVNWVLKRSGSLEQRCSKMPAPESKEED
jgi:hypothetical protein